MPFNSGNLKIATDLAEKFLNDAKKARPDVKDGEGNASWCCGTATTGQLRRTSMDLTRALANLRKSRL